MNGLRAIAVIAVVLFHYGVRYFDGGYVGVDVFFVISGFLLTSIAHGRLQKRQYSAVQFLLNRLRRIFPALLVTVIGCWIWATLFYLPDDLSRLVRNGTAALLFRSNYAFLGDAGGYFAPDARSNILLHTWSLAVESQFYLMFAITCALFWPAAGARRKVAGWLLFGVVGLSSLVWCVVPTPAHQRSAFYLLWGRAWEFMAGSVVALLPARKRRGAANVVAVAGAALLLAAVFDLHADDPYPGWRAILPVAGTALIIYAGEGFLTTVLSGWPLQFLGAISYSVYLWHWPILLMFRERAGAEPSPLQAALLILVSIAAGWLSYACVEQPGRKRLRMFPSRSCWRLASPQASPLLRFSTKRTACKAGDIVKQVGNVTLVDPFEALCNQQVCFTVKDGVGPYKDTDHLTQDGVRLLAPRLSSAIRQSLVDIGAIEKP
nr:MULTISPECIES: acyltransferase family protein [Paraburkholderia]